MNEILSRINEIMKLDIENNNVLDIWRYEVICRFIVEDYDWKSVQEALFQALIDDRPNDEYNVIAQVFWAGIDKWEIDKDRAVALINYRLNPFGHPYEDNLAWSITSALYKLDYADSEYNAFKDEKILSIMRQYFQIP